MAAPEHTYDIAIVGYGPTGATLANFLGMDGIRVLVLERDAEIYDQPRAIGFDHEVMRIFQAAGVADDVLRHTATMRSSNYLGARGQVIREFKAIDPPYMMGWPPNYVFDQPGLEGALRVGVAKYPSVDVKLRHQMESFEDYGDGVTIHARDLETDKVQTFEATYVIGCDGARSLVRQTLGIAFEDLGFDEPWLVVDVFVKDVDQFPQVNQQMCNPDRPMTFIVGPNNHRRWEIMLMPGETPEEIDQLPRIYELLKPFGEPDDFEIRRSATYRFHALVAANWRKGRVLLAGDAAHQTPPFIGQGMCQGIRDASALSWRLAAIINDRLNDGVLDSYTVERKPHVTAVTQTTKSLGEEICMLDREKAAKRDAILEAELAAGVQNTIRQNLIPGLEAGAIDLAGAEAARQFIGKLAVQPKVSTMGEKPELLDEVAGRCFWLILNGIASDLLPNTEQRDFWQQIGGKVIALTRSKDNPERCASIDMIVTDEDELMVQFFENAGCAGVIVRPDRYIYGLIFSADDLNRQFDDIKAWLTGRGD